MIKRRALVSKYDKEIMEKPKKEYRKDIPRCKNEHLLFEKELFLQIEEFRLARLKWLSSAKENLNNRSRDEDIIEPSVYRGRCVCLRKIGFKSSKLRNHYKTLKPLRYFTLKQSISESGHGKWKYRRKNWLHEWGHHFTCTEQFEEEMKLRVNEPLKCKAKGKAKGRKKCKKKKKKKKEKSESKKESEKLEAAENAGKDVICEKYRKDEEVTVVMKDFCPCNKGNLKQMELEKVDKVEVPAEEPEPQLVDPVEVHKKQQLCEKGIQKTDVGWPTGEAGKNVGLPRSVVSLEDFEKCKSKRIKKREKPEQEESGVEWEEGKREVKGKECEYMKKKEKVKENGTEFREKERKEKEKEGAERKKKDCRITEEGESKMRKRAPREKECGQKEEAIKLKGEKRERKSNECEKSEKRVEEKKVETGSKEKECQVKEREKLKKERNEPRSKKYGKEENEEDEGKGKAKPGDNKCEKSEKDVHGGKQDEKEKERKKCNEKEREVKRERKKSGERQCEAKGGRENSEERERVKKKARVKKKCSEEECDQTDKEVEVKKMRRGVGECKCEEAEKKKVKREGKGMDCIEKGKEMEGKKDMREMKEVGRLEKKRKKKEKNESETMDKQDLSSVVTLFMNPTEKKSAMNLTEEQLQKLKKNRSRRGS